MSSCLAWATGEALSQNETNLRYPIGARVEVAEVTAGSV